MEYVIIVVCIGAVLASMSVRRGRTPGVTMTKTHRTALAACLIAVSVNAIAGSGNTPAAPFGIEMGSPGSCKALPIKLKSIDPRLSISPVDPKQPPTPDIYRYEPIDKIFPGATGYMTVICAKGQIELLQMTVKRGAYDFLLLETLIGLDDKYERFNDSGQVRSLSTLIAKGKAISYSAGKTVVEVELFKGEGADVFGLLYRYDGPIGDASFKAERSADEDRVRRKNAL